MQAAVAEIAELIKESCSCLLQQLEQLAEVDGLLQDWPTSAAGAAPAASSRPSHLDDDGRGISGNGAGKPAATAGARFREVLIRSVREDGVISWLVPPMLQGSNTDLGGWV